MSAAAEVGDGKFIIPGGLGAQLCGIVVPEPLAALRKAALWMPLCLNP